MRPNFAQYAFDSCMQRPIDGTTAGARMPATAKLFSNLRHVELAFTSKTHTKSSIRELAEERCDFHVTDGKSVVNQSFAILLLGAYAFHLLLRNPDPSKQTFALQSRKRGSEQSQLRRRVSEINVS